MIEELTSGEIHRPEGRALIGLEGRSFGRCHSGCRGDPESQGERAALAIVTGREIGIRRLVVAVSELTVMVVTEVDVEVEEPGFGLAVAVPIGGCMGAEAQCRQRREHCQQRTEPPHATPEGQTQPSQHTR